MKNLIKDQFDVIYLIISFIILCLDFIVENDIIEASAFILISIAFIFVAFPSNKSIKDERISYLKLFSGYIAFMSTIIVLSIISFIYRYIGFEFNFSDITRYLTLFMFFVFSLSYVLIKRKY